MSPTPAGSRAQSQSQSQSQSPSREPSPEPQPQRQKSRRRGRSCSRRSLSVASAISDSGAEEIHPKDDRRRRRRNKKRQSGLPVVDEVEATGREVVNAAGGAVQTVGDTVGQVASSAGGDKPLKLRLDLNLDADIRLTAKVHGDVTLSLL